MQIRLSGHHATISDKLKEYVDKRFAKLERHFDHITQVHVIVTKQKHGYHAEATVHASHTELFADAYAPEPFAAIDALRDKLDRQVLKYKGKVVSHRVPAH